MAEIYSYGINAWSWKSDFFLPNRVAVIFFDSSFKQAQSVMTNQKAGKKKTVNTELSVRF